MVHSEVSLNLTIDDNYKKTLYKDVCQEYIKDLNKELQKVHEQMSDIITEPD